MKQKMNLSRISRMGLLLGLIVFACFAAARSQTGQPVTPFLDEIIVNPASGYATAYFGYTNPNVTAVTINIGETQPQNFFFPSPQDRGQLTRFVPGTHRYAFASVWRYADDPQITWILNGTSIVANSANVTPQLPTSIFTYQGRLSDNNAAASGTFDLEFKLFIAGGAQIGPPQVKDDVPVTSGVFTVQLDAALFGPTAFNGGERTLEIGVRRGTETGAFTTLTPRQPITSAPYAIRSLNSAMADTATSAGTAVNAASFTGNLSGDVSGTQISTAVNTVAGQTAANVGTATQLANAATAANTANAIVRRDASGNFTAGTINAVTQYNINANRVLGVAGTENLFVGVDIGTANTGANNSFVGTSAGKSNTSGHSNSFFGREAGFRNTNGRFNSMFGMGAGGGDCGTPCPDFSTGDNNSFFGFETGLNNTTGGSNTFVGKDAGKANTTGSNNVFAGTRASENNTTGGRNVFVGLSAGDNNTTGSDNTAIGADANVSPGTLTFATAIGAGASVFTSNTISLGRNTDKVKINGLGSGGLTDLCINSVNDVSVCSSSLRYKTGIAPFNFGLNVVKRLQPISFTWKDGGMPDVGFGAEDVAQVNPLFVTYNAKGEVEGVKYDRLSVIFVNAFKEQQTQIEAQAKQLAEQRLLIDGLRKLVCQTNAAAEICQNRER